MPAPNSMNGHESLTSVRLLFWKLNENDLSSSSSSSSSLSSSPPPTPQGFLNCLYLHPFQPTEGNGNKTETMCFNHRIDKVQLEWHNNNNSVHPISLHNTSNFSQTKKSQFGSCLLHVYNKTDKSVLAKCERCKKCNTTINPGGNLVITVTVFLLNKCFHQIQLSTQIKKSAQCFGSSCYNQVNSLLKTTVIAMNALH